MNVQLPLWMIDEWTPAQKLAVYDFCRLISETLWQQYQTALLDEMIRLDRDNGFEHLYHQDDRNLELPFDDEELPF